MTENEIAKIIVDAAYKVHVALGPGCSKQLLTYLRLARMHLGLLINFGSAMLRSGITRVVNGLDE